MDNEFIDLLQRNELLMNRLISVLGFITSFCFEKKNIFFF